MRLSNLEIEDVWAEVSTRCHERRRQMPIYLRLTRRIFHGLLELAWRRI
jgi:hypothetical protein